MKRSSLILAALVLLFASCGKKLTPVQLDAEIVGINDSLKIKGQAWITELGKSFMSRNFAPLSPLRQDVANFLDKKIAYVGEMEDVGGSEAYRNAELNFLKYEREMVEHAFMPFEQFNASSSNEEIQAVLNKLAPISDKEIENMNIIWELQTKYAEKNNFKPLRSNLSDDNK